MKILARIFLLASLLLVALLALGAQAASAVPIYKTVLVLSPFQLDLSTNPITRNESNRFIFDHPALQRFDLTLSLLPPDSIVKNRRFLFRELYQPQIIASSIGIAILLLLVVFLLGMTRQLRRTRRALAHLNASLETQVQERTAMLNQTNTQLQDEITERKRMEAALRDSEARTATILRFSPIVIGVSTVAEGRFTDINDAFERVLGYSQAETIGHTSYDLNLWVDDDTRPNILREIQAHGRVENLEIRLRRKSGEVFPALIFITPISLRDTACLLTMMMDITDRKQVEEQLRETRDALQTIIYSSPLAILALDAEDRVTMWNPAAEAMFGWADKQILGQANPTVPENKLKEYEALRRATLSGMAFSNLDTLRIKKDGIQFPVSLSVAPLRGQQSQVIGRMHVIADITERKKLQEELRQQATTDELTRVSNRRHFMELAQSEIKRAVRFKRPPAVALIDIDHFKKINDTLGHAAGDQALVAFTKICQKQIREIDVFARFGGDEFVLLLPETNQEQAYKVVERIRLALATQPIDLDGKPVAFTISSGITSLCGDQGSIDTLLSQADQALYRAKETGRNTVVRYDELRE